MTDKEALTWVAHRAVACYRDPEFDDSAQDKRDNDEYNKGVSAVIELIEAAKNDKICPECGNTEHRPDTMPGISMETFNKRHGVHARMLR